MRTSDHPAFPCMCTNEIDLVLEDEDVLELHDLDGGQMLRRLRLRARLVSGDEQQGGVHHRGSVQHGGHQNIVTGAVGRGAQHEAMTRCEPHASKCSLRCINRCRLGVLAL